ncbi:hypothetical protein ABGN05_20360, partial [Aquibium sp. LZ166]
CPKTARSTPEWPRSDQGAEKHALRAAVAVSTAQIIRLLRVSSYIGVMFAIVVAIYEYKNNVDQSKISQSVALLSAFTDPDVLEHRRAIELPWLNYDLRKISEYNSNAEAIDAIAKEIVDASIETEYSLIYVIDRLDIIGRCIKTHVCDGRVVSDQIGDYVENLICLYGAEIEALRVERLLPTLGDGLVTIAASNRCASFLD